MNMSDKTTDEPTTLDPELIAIREIVWAMNGLPPEAWPRVLLYLNSRYKQVPRRPGAGESRDEALLTSMI